MTYQINWLNVECKLVTLFLDIRSCLTMTLSARSKTLVTADSNWRAALTMAVFSANCWLLVCDVASTDVKCWMLVPGDR